MVIRNIILSLSILFLLSCSSITRPVMTDNNRNIQKINIGDSRAKVTEIMGYPDKNPYKKEAIIQNGKTYEIFFYYTDKSIYIDGGISDDETTPVIFYNGYVIGYGWLNYKQLFRLSNY